MGKVHVGAAGWLANNTSSWDNPSVNNPAVVEEIPRVIDDWPEESTGKIYRVYSNSSEPVFTGEYQGNRNLMSGATAVIIQIIKLGMLVGMLFIKMIKLML